MRIENPLLARGTEYFSLARTFRTVWRMDRESFCAEQVHSQRIYPGCSYGGDAHRSGSYGDGDGCCVRGEDLRNIVGDESHSDDTSGKCYRGNVRCECFRYKV